MNKDPLEDKELDQPSGVFVTRTIDGKKIEIELSFRELHDECLTGSGMMKTWDGLSADMRFDNQRANDKHYVPIKPMAGLKGKRSGRWRG